MLSRIIWSSQFQRLRNGSRHSVVALVSAMTLAAAGTLAACSGERIEPTAPAGASSDDGRSVLLPVSARDAGSLHNEFLAFAFPRIRDAVAAGADHGRACRVIAQAMREFVVARRLAVNPRTIRDDVAGGRCAGSRERAPTGEGGQPQARPSLADDGIPVPELEPIVTEMAAAVEMGWSREDLATLFDHKVAYARAHLPEAEAEVVVAAASVGLSSVDYWDVNYQSHEEELLAALDGADYSRAAEGESGLTKQPAGRSDARLTPRFSSFWAKARTVGKADLIGGVRGGIKGISGGWAGIGAGALVEGGAASAGALVGLLLQ